MLVTVAYHAVVVHGKVRRQHLGDAMTVVVAEHLKRADTDVTLHHLPQTAFPAAEHAFHVFRKERTHVLHRDAAVLAGQHEPLRSVVPHIQVAVAQVGLVFQHRTPRFVKVLVRIRPVVRINLTDAGREQSRAIHIVNAFRMLKGQHANFRLFHEPVEANRASKLVARNGRSVLSDGRFIVRDGGSILFGLAHGGCSNVHDLPVARRPRAPRADRPRGDTVVQHCR